MSAKSDAHKFALRIDGGSIWLAVECPYDRADESRPCWPYDENGGHPDAPAKWMCTYEEWIDATGYEDILHGDVSIPLDAHAFWDNGGFIVEVEDGRALTAAEPARPDHVAQLAAALQTLLAYVTRMMVDADHDTARASILANYLLGCLNAMLADYNSREAPNG